VTQVYCPGTFLEELMKTTLKIYGDMRSTIRYINRNLSNIQQLIQAIEMEWRRQQNWEVNP
jgi:hypothetical protein